MSEQISLKEAERKTFRTAYNDGLWDIFLGCVLLMFVIAPYLSSRLGDFWSSAVFLPFWALIYLAIRLIRKYVVAPRIGMVAFGPVRKAKLTRFTLVMLTVNVIALILGALAALNFGRIPGQTMSIIFGMFLLVGFSFAGYMLDFGRLYLYGLLIGFSPLVGEWLWDHGYATHHGFPITFGTTAGIIIVVGLILFIRLLHDNPLPTGIPTENT
jgi:hypothetical protein